MNGFFKGFPSGESISANRGLLDSLPAIVDAVAKVPATLKELPPAPVILGAFSRMIATALGAELVRRGPSARFINVCSSSGIGEAAALELHESLVDEMRIA